MDSEPQFAGLRVFSRNPRFTWISGNPYFLGIDKPDIEGRETGPLDVVRCVSAAKAVMTPQCEAIAGPSRVTPPLVRRCTYEKRWRRIRLGRVIGTPTLPITL